MPLSKQKILIASVIMQSIVSCSWRNCVSKCLCRNSCTTTHGVFMADLKVEPFVCPLDAVKTACVFCQPNQFKSLLQTHVENVTVHGTLQYMQPVVDCGTAEAILLKDGLAAEICRINFVANTSKVRERNALHERRLRKRSNGVSHTIKSPRRNRVSETKS
jgi:hypothetical protein